MIGIVLSMSLFGASKAQSLYTGSMHPSVKTVQISSQEGFGKMPILSLDGNNSLTISFDYLADYQPLIDYKLVHCDAQWVPDDLDAMDCLEYSYLPLHVENITPSFNTSIPYFHYEVEFPGTDIHPTVSGNFAMLFHLQDEPDSLIAVATFVVSEQCAFVNAKVSADTDIGFQSLYQQLTLDISWSAVQFPYLEPANDFRIIVSQNSRRDSRRLLPPPSRMSNGHAYYEHERSLIFDACNQWRRFEFTDERYPGLGVDHVQYHNPIYYAYLNRDRQRTDLHYRYDQDQHGRYLVHALRVNDPDTEGDYFMAMFTLDAPAKLSEQGVYLMGDLTDQIVDDCSRMEYDAVQGLYFKELLLKKGVYNYMYVTPVDNNRYTTYFTEGNHWETVNEYQVLIYYRPFGSRYDRLLGVGTF